MSVDLARVLDLTDESKRQALGISAGDLTRDSMELCQDIADLSRAAQVRGILAPSAALQGGSTLALFAPYLKSGARLEHQRVQIMPVTLADHAAQIRLVPEASAAARRFMADVASGGREFIRRLRRAR